MPAPSFGTRNGRRPGNERRGHGSFREPAVRRRQQEAPEHSPRPAWRDLRIPLTWIKALTVLPLTLASLVTIVTLLRLLRVRAQAEAVAQVPSIRWFLFGSLALLVLLLIAPLRRPLRSLYVLGHELAHCLAVYLSFGWVSKLVWSSEGGYILANRSNTLITLSPYLLPFWAMLWTLWLWGLNQIVEVPRFELLLCAGLGVSISFHLLFTLWMSSMDQSDFQPNGLAFSLLLIASVNSFWLLLLLGWGDPAIDARDIVSVWKSSAVKLAELAARLWQPAS